ncbi:MAG: sigma factor-like helix-turn-helix DNA-binding protein [Acidimicrobiia bacterium]
MPEPSAALRPLERVVVRLQGEGATSTEIATMIGKKPGTVDRILQMVDFKKSAPILEPRADQALRPVERVVLRLRKQGEGYGEIGNRLGMSGHQVRRIEGYARFKTSD